MKSRTLKGRKLLTAGSIVVLVVGMLAGAAGSALAVHNDGLFELDTSGIAARRQREHRGQRRRAATTGPPSTTVAAAPSPTRSSRTRSAAPRTASTPAAARRTSGTSPTGSTRHPTTSSRTRTTSPTRSPPRTRIAATRAADQPHDRLLRRGSLRQQRRCRDRVLVLPGRGRPWCERPASPAHTKMGDVLVLANWGGSNPVGEVTVYTWVGGKNPLALVFDSLEADCAVAGTNDNVCAVVNRANDNPPWPFIDKAGSQDIRPLELFEAGIDLTALFGEDICFASFMAATRSSHSTTAQLKDFDARRLRAVRRRDHDRPRCHQRSRRGAHLHGQRHPVVGWQLRPG